MWRIGWQVQKEGTLAVSLDELRCQPEKDVRTVPAVSGRLILRIVVIVEVVVAPVVRRLGDASTAADHGLVEAPIRGPHRVVLAEVPFSEDAGAVTVPMKDVSHGRNAGAKDGPASGGRRYRVAQGVLPCEQSGTGRRAQGVGMVIGETHALAMQTVQVRSPQPRVAMAVEVTIPLIIGHHHDDVGAALPLREGQGPQPKAGNHVDSYAQPQ